MITRRETLILMGAAAIAAKVGIQPAAAQNVNPAEILKPGALPDIWQGPESAKVAIVEYASLTCSHCANFHNTTYKELKKRYIDSGQLRFVLRPFSLNQIDTAAYMLALAEPAKYYGITDLLFETQNSWAFTQKPLDELRKLLRQAGFSEEKFNQTLRDQKLLDGVNASRQRGADVFKVDATPTIFVNGIRVQGETTIEGMEKIIKPALGA